MEPIQTTDVYWHCARKSAYPDLETARKYARLRTEKSGEQIMAYPCKYCGKFHIGHVTPEAMRKARQRKNRKARERARKREIACTAPETSSTSAE